MEGERENAPNNPYICDCIYGPFHEYYSKSCENVSCVSTILKKTKTFGSASQES